jgi:8-oxo-dGTP diphosphatase
MTEPVGPPATEGLRIREAVRAIVRAPDERVLLVRFEFPTESRWALPGGGLDPGETHEEALRRELHEELGLTWAQIGPHVWNRVHIVPFLDGRFDGQRERIHVVDIEATFEPQPAIGWEQMNAEFVFELRWWRLDEIEAATDVRFVPAPLGELLRRLVAEGPPNPPIDVST